MTARTALAHLSLLAQPPGAFLETSASKETPVVVPSTASAILTLKQPATQTLIAVGLGQLHVSHVVRRACGIPSAVSVSMLVVAPVMRTRLGYPRSRRLLSLHVAILAARSLQVCVRGRFLRSAWAPMIDAMALAMRVL